MTDDELATHLSLLGVKEQPSERWKYVFWIKELHIIVENDIASCIYCREYTPQIQHTWEIGASKKTFTAQEIYDFIINLKVKNKHNGV